MQGFSVMRGFLLTLEQRGANSYEVSYTNTKDFYKTSDLANLFWKNITVTRVDWFQYKYALAIGFNI